jgi:hypothetical protein
LPDITVGLFSASTYRKPVANRLLSGGLLSGNPARFPIVTAQIIKASSLLQIFPVQYALPD